MSTYRVDIGVKVTADTAEHAAQICAAILTIGAEIAGPGVIVPAFVGVHAAEPEPEPKPGSPETADLARSAFDRIMESPSA